MVTPAIAGIVGFNTADLTLAVKVIVVPSPVAAASYKELLSDVTADAIFVAIVAALSLEEIDTETFPVVQ